MSTRSAPLNPWKSLSNSTTRPLRSAALETEFAQARVLRGTSAERPMIFALGLRNRQIVDAGDAQSHQSMLVEFPVFIAVAAKPMTAVVVPLVGKSHGYSVVAKGPEFLDEPIVEFAGPLAREKRLDGIAPLQEFGAVAPTALLRIGKRDPSRVARVPSVFGHADFLNRSLQSKRRQRRSIHG